MDCCSVFSKFFQNQAGFFFVQFCFQMKLLLLHFLLIINIRKNHAQFKLFPPCTIVLSLPGGRVKWIWWEIVGLIRGHKLKMSPAQLLPVQHCCTVTWRSSLCVSSSTADVSDAPSAESFKKSERWKTSNKREKVSAALLKHLDGERERQFRIEKINKKRNLCRTPLCWTLAPLDFWFPGIKKCLAEYILLSELGWV